MVTCPDCDARFDTERGLEIHRSIDHADSDADSAADTGSDHGGDIGAMVVDAWNNPRFAFLFGLIAGVVLVGTVVLSSPSAFTGDSTEQVGQTVLGHYESRAPPGVSYTLADVTEQDSGMYAVTLDVTTAADTYQETVYVTPDGGHVFEVPPQRLTADFSAATGDE